VYAVILQSNVGGLQVILKRVTKHKNAFHCNLDNENTIVNCNAKYVYISVFDYEMYFILCCYSNVCILLLTIWLNQCQPFDDEKCCPVVFFI